MRYFRLLLPVIASGALLGACADERYSAAYVGGGPVAVGYDGYYDDYYGPFNDGYWAGDGYFYFADRDGHFRRDDGRHFRRGTAQGFHPVHGQGHARAAPPHQGPRDHP